jgi:16S rRNA (adenine1518-N6/adenine1519-N6)-dimethyltransferase
MPDAPEFQQAPTDGDLLPIVNANDELIGVKPRRAVHLQKLRHRAVHVGVFDGAGRLWLQKRAAGKDTYPGWWDLSATGHVDPGETYEDAARRELREELGIDAEPAAIVKLPASERSGWEFHALFWVRWDDPIADFNREEIAEVRLFSIEEMNRAIADGTGGMRMTTGVADGLPHLVGAENAGRPARD